MPYRLTPANPRRLFGAFLATLGICLACVPMLQAEEAPAENTEGRFQKILVADFEGPIETMTWVYMQRVIERAKNEKFDCLVLRIDSPGGTIFHSMKVGDALFDLTDIHTIAWVPVEAISGACLTAMACNEIVMGPNATIGDCQPIIPTAEGYEALGEKVQSPLRATFRKYAERNGYSIPLAEAFVSERVSVIEVQARYGGQRYFIDADDFESADDDTEIVEGHTKSDLKRRGGHIVSDKELLTITAEETLRYGFQARKIGPTGLPRTEAEFLGAIKGEGATVTYEEPSFFERASAFLLGLAGILSVVALLGAIMTIKSGTFGVMGIVGSCALILLILINSTADQVYGFPIFLILLGALLLAAEVFVIPGFGIAGILGIISMVAGLFFLGTGTTFGETDGRIPDGAFTSFALQFIFGTIFICVAFLFLSRYFPKLGPGRRMVLEAPGASTSPVASPAAHLPAIGDVGFTTTVLRPAGSAEFAGALVDVVSEGEFLESGLRVRVTGIEGAEVRVAVDEAGA